VLLSYNCKEVLAVSRTQAQAIPNQPQEELLLAVAKRSSCLCITFGLYYTVKYSKQIAVNSGKLPCKKMLIGNYILQPFGQFHKPLERFGKPFGKFHKPFERCGEPFGIPFSRSVKPFKTAW